MHWFSETVLALLHRRVVGLTFMRGKYTNYFEVRYTATEFLLDFGEHYPESEPPLLHTRLVTSVESAETLAQLLTEALKRQKLELERIEDARQEDR